jgi:putative DNA primase/helicase
VSHDTCTPVVPIPAIAIAEIVAEKKPSGSCNQWIGKKLPPWPPDWGRPITGWLYLTANGEAIGFVVRFEKMREDGTLEKNPIPLSYGRDDKGSAHWHWKSFAKPRPLYSLERLATNPQATAIIVEGEKCATALQQLLDDAHINSQVAITWPGGANHSAIDNTDWSPLQGREAIVFPDNDEPGFKAAALIARTLESAQISSAGTITRSIRIVRTDADWPAGHDVADLIESGWDSAKVLGFITSRTVAVDHFESLARERFGKVSEKSGAASKQKSEPTQADQLIALASAEALFHDDERCYATVKIENHLETHAIRSPGFRRWLLKCYFEQNGKSPNGEAVSAAVSTIEALALYNGEQRNAFVRVASQGDKLFLDLCNKAWQVVEISREGWRIVESNDCPVRFRRAKGMLALPTPEAGGSVEELRQFLNVASDDDFKLVLGWLLSCYQDRGPYPVLALHGEQGCAKSTAARVIRLLIDPNRAPLRSEPKEPSDLMIAANNGWIIAFDNLSHLPTWLSDAICRLATGGGFSTRELYTDEGEVIFEAKRPVLLIGIEELATRGDLADRAIVIIQQRISDDKRITEGEFEQLFNAARPRLLGALLNTVGRALASFDAVKLSRMPRMADFAKRSVAAERALGWEPGTFMRAYDRNREDANETTLEASPVAQAVRALGNFAGTQPSCSKH